MTAADQQHDLQSDETFRSFVNVAANHAVALCQLADAEQPVRPGLAETIRALAQAHAGQTLDLVQRWPA